MAQSWPFTGGNHQWNCEIASTYQVYQDALDQGIQLGTLWYTEFPQMPVNINNGREAEAIEDWSRIIPGMKVIRQPFNTWFFYDRFNDVDTGKFVFEKTEAYIQAQPANGWEILWTLCDGPSQRTGSNEPGIVDIWTSYPPINEPEDWLLESTWDKIHAGQVDGFTRMINYLKLPENAAVLGATIAFEAINEPDSYRAGEAATGNSVFFQTKYVDHCLALFDMVEAAFPGNTFDFYVGGWRFSATLDELDVHVLPKYGKTAYHAIRDHIGEKLVWSIHMYTNWITETNNWDELYNTVFSRFQFALDNGDRINLNETNFRTADCDYLESIDGRITFMWSRVMQLFAEKNMSFMYWPLFNWAQGRLISARGGVLPHHGFQNAMGAYLRKGTYNNNLDWMTQPDTGERDPAYIIPCATVTNHPNDPDYPVRVNDPVSSFAVTFGGRGVAVCHPDESSNNYQYGGNGRNILYGSQEFDDNLNLGRGGGVVRCYGGYNRVNVVESENLVYAGSLWTQVVGYTGQMTVVVDPTATTIIVGWNARKGDRLSFKAAFADPAALAAAMSTQPGVQYPTENNLIINFPQGGTLTLWDRGEQKDYIHQSVLDFTDGWYAPGWVEPADYDPADFALPIVDPPPPFPSNTPEGDFGFWRSGVEVGAFWRSGLPVQTLRKWG